MNVGIFYNREPKSETPGEGVLYVDYPQWRNYPHELLAAIAAKGATPVIVGKHETYTGNNTFSRYWVADPKNVGNFTLVDEPITLDAIFDKGYFRKQASFCMVNVPGLAKLGRDKSAQYELFGDLQPQSVTVRSAQEFTDAVQAMPSELVVTKPLDKNGGKDIVIKPKQELLAAVPDFTTGASVLVQQFVDSSGGIPGIASGHHDLRLYVINGEAVFASVRQPRQGSLVANTSQGGSIDFFDVADIPQAPVELAKKVDQHMQQFGNRYYSVDFVSQGNTWYVIEINDRPGVPARFQSPAVENFHNKLAACIVEAVNNPRNFALKDASD